MKTMISIMAAAGLITAISFSALAAEGHNIPGNTPASTQVESAITEIAEGLDPMATAEDSSGNGEAVYTGVRLVEDGGEYNPELGEGLSRTDTRKDLVDNLYFPAQQ
ncbi:MAG: hypothetical protein Q4G07_01370 [Oscillospiraceae bacterium]|nr:hypothetical protein [Oscillospiraceae bacterium]